MDACLGSGASVYSFSSFGLRDSVPSGHCVALLLGPFIDAWLKIHPHNYTGGRRFLDGILPHLGDKCIAAIGEIFDGNALFRPRSCISQAWSVAEVLRERVKTSGSDALP